MIQLLKARKNFGSRTAVEDLDLHVPSGEIFGLLGHNGAGKSTAIGMMLGQIWPTAGEIRVCGFDVTSQRAEALRHVGAIFEMPAFYDYLTAWENLEIFSHYTAITPAARIREVIEWVGLNGRETSKVKTFSHGMRARLALAQALLPQPRLLILDEPGDGLDPEGIHDLRQTSLRLHRDLGLTIVLSSHLLNEVEQVCTRIAVLNRGRKVFEGTVADATQNQNRVRLVVNDFAGAVMELRQANLITGTQAEQFIFPADNVPTSQIVQLLVERRIQVLEIARAAQTLEDFYLSLVKPD